MKIAILVSLALVAALHARAEADSCTLPSHASVERYFSGTSTTDDPRCSFGFCSLSGYLFRPATARPGPAITFVHGSVNDDGGVPTMRVEQQCNLIRYFVNHGFAVFVPFGRGIVDDSQWPCGDGSFDPTCGPSGSGFANTGTNLQNIAHDGCNGPDRSNTFLLQFVYGVQNPTDTDCNIADVTFAMRSEARDEGLAMQHLATLNVTGSTQKLATKIALVGHSLGGATVALAAGQSLAHQPDAIVDQSGAVLSFEFGTAVWTKDLGDAVAARTVPMMLMQTANESPTDTLDSTRLPFLAGASDTSRPEVEMAVYSDAEFDLGQCPAGFTPEHCAHVKFQANFDEVQRWAPAVAEFLARQGF